MKIFINYQQYQYNIDADLSWEFYDARDLHVADYMKKFPCDPEIEFDVQVAVDVAYVWC